MFTYVKARNFKSLKDIKFDLNKAKTKTNQLIAIYGENGSGKTNIVKLFELLQELVLSRKMDINRFGSTFMQEEDIEVIKKYKNSHLRGIYTTSMFFGLREYRMLNERKPTEIEYGFKINNIEGFYYIKFDNEIKEEKMYYIAGKQRAYLFNLVKKHNKIEKELNNNIFISKKYNEELSEIIDKYWGKYSFLSLLEAEREEKNSEYINNSISKNIFEVIDKILSVKIHEEIEKDNLFVFREINSIESGSIKKEELTKIKKYEKILNIFFTQAYADIKEVKYSIFENMDKYYYDLYFKKMIGGKIKLIPVRMESDGTKRILKQFDTLIGCLLGETVIIDEIDNGIHDVLMKNIIMSIKDEITGQLIITTHNTLLLEILPKEYIYILSTDCDGNKMINSIKEYNIKVQKNNNARDLYFKGVFGGIPTTDYIDFEEIKYALEDSEENEEDTNVEET